MNALSPEVRNITGKPVSFTRTCRRFFRPGAGRRCVNCHVKPDVKDEKLHTLSCDWDSRAVFEEYIRSGSGSALIGALDLLVESARVQLGIDANWEGSEALKRIRRES